MAKFYAKSIGAPIDVDTGLPPPTLAAAQAVGMQILRPSGVVSLLTANIVTGTSLVRHISAAADSFSPGLHKLQALVTFTTGTIECDTANLVVFDDFE